MDHNYKKRLQDLLHILPVQGASGVQFYRGSLSDGSQIAVSLQIEIERLDDHDDHIQDSSIKLRFYPFYPL